MPATKKQSVSQNEVSNDTQTVKEATGMSVEDMLAMIAWRRERYGFKDG